MIVNKLKNKFKSLDDKLQENKNILQDQLALTQLLAMFKNNMFFPLTGWSISPREVMHICNDIVINKRESVVEFGLGFSTICVAQLIKKNKLSTQFISVENDKSWFDDFQKLIKKLDLSDYVKCVYAPISTIQPKFSIKSQKLWYNTQFLDKEIKNLNHVDLVIIDGPFGGTTPYARYSAIPYLKDKLSNSYTIFLDDSSRPEETEIIKVWKKSLNCKVVNKIRYAVLTNTNGFDATPVNM